MSGMGINQEGADNALRNIDEVVNRVNDLMKDRGRRSPSKINLF